MNQKDWDTLRYSNPGPAEPQSYEPIGKLGHRTDVCAKTQYLEGIFGQCTPPSGKEHPSLLTGDHDLGKWVFRGDE